MSVCRRARDLFGAYWDDETTRAEREWLDAHFSSCAGCRTEYEALARTLSAVAALPRAEASPGLAERALAAIRHASPVPDVVFVRETPRWVPVAGMAAAALIVAAGMAPLWLRTSPVGPLTLRSHAVGEPRLVGVASSPGHAASRSTATTTRAEGAVATISDSLFDHSADVDFVLDPVTLHRGRAHTASQLPRGIQGEQAVITF